MYCTAWHLKMQHLHACAAAGINTPEQVVVHCSSRPQSEQGSESPAHKVCHQAAPLGRRSFLCACACACGAFLHIYVAGHALCLGGRADCWPVSCTLGPCCPLGAWGALSGRSGSLRGSSRLGLSGLRRAREGLLGLSCPLLWLSHIDSLASCQLLFSGAPGIWLAHGLRALLWGARRLEGDSSSPRGQPRVAGIVGGEVGQGLAQGDAALGALQQAGLLRALILARLLSCLCKRGGASAAARSSGVLCSLACAGCMCEVQAFRMSGVPGLPEGTVWGPLVLDLCQGELHSGTPGQGLYACRGFGRAL